MIISEDRSIRLGGVTLPGLVKKVEIKSSAAIDEVEVEGSSVKPKNPVGYEDAKVDIELIVGDTAEETALDKLSRINSIFKTSGQAIPIPLPLVCSEAASIGLTTVLFKDFNYSKTNKSDQYSVKLTLWEYVPMPITATVTADTGTPELTSEYSGYLSSRGTAPKIGDKTAASPTAYWEDER